MEDRAAEFHHDSGPHRDMDYMTFKRSIKAIVPYIAEMACECFSFDGRLWLSEKLDNRRKTVGCADMLAIAIFFGKLWEQKILSQKELL